VFPAGDLELRRAVRRLYALDRMPSEDEVLRIAELAAVSNARRRVPVPVRVRRGQTDAYDVSTLG
jgi:hypothetical protein